ncbi:MAG: PPE family protein [Rhodococcus sp. (in: high G+C Gram-positive bacteria)]|uniref:PPE family protein n=1 Tax=Rhodococcus sp. TaxID=1831 RepID=UPI003BAF0333
MGVEPWGLYPPEINAGRYDAGVGPGPWIAATLEWGAMAAMANEAIAALGVQVGSITGQWEGMASARMGAASAPYVAWLSEMSANAMLNVQRSAAVVQAYAAGRTAMVPLPIIIANRVAARTAQLIGALGAPNTEMVRLEIEYAAFWTHNSSVMTIYDAAVNAATTPTPVSPPPLLVVDAAPGVSMQTQLQQFGQRAGNPIGSGRSVPTGMLNQYAGPSLSNSSSLARMLGSGAGSGAAFGGRGASSGARTGGAGGASDGLSGGLSGLLTPPLTSFSAPSSVAGGAQSGLAFGGVQNTPSTARPAAPMAPPMGRGSRLQKSLEQHDRETITAAHQEFVAAPEMSNNDGERSGEAISVPAQLR